MLESWLTISPLAVNLVIALPKSPMSSMFCSKSFSELSSELSSDEGLSLSKSPPSDSSELSEIFANSARYSSNKKFIFVRLAPDKFRSLAISSDFVDILKYVSLECVNLIDFSKSSQESIDNG